MDLPREYSYNPQLRLIFWTVGAGLAWILVLRSSSGQMPHGFGLWLGVIPIMLGLLLALRRVAVDRRLLLDKEQLVLPTGFLQRHTARIPYASIERVWRTYLPFTVVLRVATKRGKFEVVSALLPDSQSYLDVEQFLTLRAQENAIE
jgi:hypothetical protein